MRKLSAKILSLIIAFSLVLSTSSFDAYGAEIVSSEDVVEINAQSDAEEESAETTEQSDFSDETVELNGQSDSDGEATEQNTSENSAGEAAEQNTNENSASVATEQNTSVTPVDATSFVITGFSSLSTITNEYKLGLERQKELLPTSVEAQFSDGTNGKAPVEDWTCNEDYDQLLGTYTFTPTIAADYVLAEDITLPVQTVVVENDDLIITENDGCEQVELEFDTSPVVGTSASDTTEINGSVTSYDKYTSSDSSYNGFEEGYLPEVRAQNPYNTCWAFASIAAVEADMIMKGTADSTIDLSELQLAYYETHSAADPTGCNDTSTQDTVSYPSSTSFADNGGTSTIAYRLFENGIGPVEEKYVPYSLGSNYSPDENDARNENAIMVNNAYNISLDNAADIKAAIKEHGAVTAAFKARYYSSYYSATYNSFYSSNYKSTDHEITLVGWDDDFPKENFKTTAEGDGAWLVRNSYGLDDYGFYGYFWISYYDSSLQSWGRVTAFDTSTTTYDNAYSYCYQLAASKTKAYEGNTTIKTTYTIGAGESIKAVAVESYYTNNLIEVTVTDGTTKSTGSITTTYAGLYTIPLDTAFTVENSTAVTVTIKINKNSDGNSGCYLEQYSTEQYSSSRVAYGNTTYNYVNNQTETYINGEKTGYDVRMALYTDDTDEETSAETVVLQAKNSTPVDATFVEKIYDYGGSTYQLSFSDSTIDLSKVTFTSSDSDIASVDTKGRITLGYGSGSCVIRAKYAGTTYECTVTVRPYFINYVVGDDVKFTRKTITFYPGSGKSVTPSTPYRAGYNFVGWYTDSDLTTAVETSKFSDKDNHYEDGVNLYPKWETSLKVYYYLPKSDYSGYTTTKILLCTISNDDLPIAVSDLITDDNSPATKMQNYKDSYSYMTSDSANTTKKETITTSDFPMKRTIASASTGSVYTQTTSLYLYPVFETETVSLDPVDFSKETKSSVNLGDTITFTGTEDGESIYYSINGKAWQNYSAPVEITSDMASTSKSVTIRVYGVNDSKEYTEISTYVYSMILPSVTATPASSSSLKLGDTVTLAEEISESTIYYSINAGSYEKYLSEVEISKADIADDGTITVKTYGTNSNYQNSDEATYTYEFQKTTLSPVVADVESGSDLMLGDTIALSNDDDDTTIYYSINGGKIQTYDGPIEITKGKLDSDNTTTLETYGTNPYYNDSEKTTYKYNLEKTKLSSNELSIEDRSFVEALTTSLTITNSDEDTVIYYSINGGEYQKYETPISFTEDMASSDGTVSISTYGTNRYYENSEVTEATYYLVSGNTNATLGDATYSDLCGYYESIGADTDSLSPDDIPTGFWLAGVYETKTYTGKAITFSGLKVYHNKKLLSLGTEYTVKYTNNVKAATSEANKAPTITITGKGGYKGKLIHKFTISQADISTYLGDMSGLLFAYNKGKKVSITLKPVATVDSVTRTLTSSDFSWTCATDGTGGCKTVGTHTLILTGKGNYTGSKSVNITITDKTLLSKVTVKTTAVSFNTSGELVTSKGVVVEAPAVTVKYGSKTYTEGVDYTITYPESYKVGTNYLTINGLATMEDTDSGQAALIGSRTVAFKVSGISINQKFAMANFDGAASVYTGYSKSGLIKDEEINPDGDPGVTIFTGTTKEVSLTRNKDYEIYYSRGGVTSKYIDEVDTTSVGTVTMIIKGIGSYTGTVTKKYKITAYNIKNDASLGDGAKISVELDSSSALYLKGGAKPKVTVTFKNGGQGTVLAEGKDYTLYYYNNTKLSTAYKSENPAYVLIKGKGNFTGMQTLKLLTKYGKLEAQSYSVVQQDIGNLTITATDRSLAKNKTLYYNKGTFTVKDLNGKALKAGTDYTFVYATDSSGCQESILGNKSSVDFSDATSRTIYIIVTGKGCYSGTLVGSYQLTKYALSSLTFTTKEQTYTGQAITLDADDISAINSKTGQIYVLGTDYIIDTSTYSNNTSAGKASVIVRGTGAYSGSKRIYFKINQVTIK